MERNCQSLQINKRKNDLTKWCSVTEAEKIKPLVTSYEVQIHSRCLNVSGILGQNLLSGACDFGEKLLSCHPHVKIDLALVFCKAFLEEKNVAFEFLFVDEVSADLTAQVKDEFYQTFRAFLSYPSLIVDGDQLCAGFIRADWCEKLGLPND